MKLLGLHCDGSIKEIKVNIKDLTKAIEEESNITLESGCELIFECKSKQRADFSLTDEKGLSYYFLIDLQLFGVNGHIYNREKNEQSLNLLVKNGQHDRFFQNDVLLLEVIEDGIWNKMSLYYKFPLENIKITPYIENIEILGARTTFNEHFNSFSLYVYYKKPNKHGDMVSAETFFLLNLQEVDETIDPECRSFLQSLISNTQWDVVNIADENSIKPLNIRFLQITPTEVVPHGHDLVKAIGLAINKDGPDDYKTHMAFVFITAFVGCLHRKIGKKVTILGNNNPFNQFNY